MRFTIYQDSRQGGRGNNEDRTTYCYSREALLMVVADGMGGHHYGEIASQIAAAVKSGVQVAVVVGGGNFFRGAELQQKGMDLSLIHISEPTRPY